MDTDKFEQRYKALQAEYRKVPIRPNDPDLNNLNEVREWVTKQEEYIESLKLESEFEVINKEIDKCIEELVNEYTGINEYKINIKTKTAIRNRAWQEHHSTSELAVIQGIKDILEELFFEFKLSYGYKIRS